ncbi:MAG: teichoic acid biosynthesis protein, partial [Butyricicoccaceae bacterium]
MNNLLEKKLITAKITQIMWERIWLSLTVHVEFAPKADQTSELAFYLVNGLYEAKAKLQVTSVEGNDYHLRINITNPGNGLCLPAGKYSIFICQDGNHLANAEADVSIVKGMADSSRNFLFRNMNCVYTVTFFVGDEDDEKRS